jgi:hypothetical protein
MHEFLDRPQSRVLVLLTGSGGLHAPPRGNRRPPQQAHAYLERQITPRQQVSCQGRGFTLVTFQSVQV